MCCVVACPGILCGIIVWGPVCVLCSRLFVCVREKVFGMVVGGTNVTACVRGATS